MADTMKRVRSARRALKDDAVVACLKKFPDQRNAEDIKAAIKVMKEVASILASFVPACMRRCSHLYS